eukprot:TRINITY_DN44773_c0_g1_i1.p1 TRINITY_DN44773_c0_g1~~TRINITY_DN44773_c0_g1_i1.p1  ORF type:complete len:695 (-),score=161.08 TRINITY_DN44773_c0_g1_i1:47-2131(-)
MEFVGLITTGKGRLWKAWVAAHWERRLRRQDYLTADVKGGIAFMSEKLGSITLACVGHLLLGFCRLLAWQGRFLDDQAHEVRTALRLSLESSSALPVVPKQTKEALTVRSYYREAHRWEQQADLPLTLGDLDEPPLPLEMLEVEAVLEEGRRYMAPIEQITLGAPPIEHVGVPGPPEEEFGALGEEERRALEAVSAEAGLRREGVIDLEKDFDLPSVDKLLGERVLRGAEGLEVPSVEGPSTERPLRPLSEPEGFPPLGEEGEGVEETPDRPTPRVLEFPSAGVSTSVSSGRPQRPTYLSDMLDFSPLLFSEDLSAEPSGEPVSAAEESGGEIPAAVAPAGPPGPPGPPPKKRRRRLKQWFDRRTEIPSKQYHDTSAITLHPDVQYDILLPHTIPGVGYTTSFSDVGANLSEAFQQALQVGNKRRRTRVEEREQRAAALQEAARAAAGGAPPPPPPADAAAAAVSTPEPSAPREGVPTPVSAAAPSVRAPTPGAPTPGAPPSVREPSERGEPSPPAREEREELPDLPHIPSFGPGLPDEEEEAPSPAGPPSAGLPSPAPPSARTPGPPSGRLPTPSRYLPTPVAAPIAGLPAAPPTPVPEDVEPPLKRVIREQDEQIVDELSESPDAVMSFLSLCRQPPSTAEAAARRFTSILAQHMDGLLSLEQDQPYSDILLRRGPHWHGPPPEAAQLVAAT